MICETILVFNTLIFAFFMAAIGRAALVFLGIVLGTGLYALSRKRSLTDMKQALYPAGEAGPTHISWMERNTSHEAQG